MKNLLQTTVAAAVVASLFAGSADATGGSRGNAKGGDKGGGGTSSTSQENPQNTKDPSCKGTITMITDEFGKYVKDNNGSKTSISIIFSNTALGTDKFSDAPGIAGLSATYGGNEKSFNDCLEGTIKHFVKTTGLAEKSTGTVRATNPQSGKVRMAYAF